MTYGITQGKRRPPVSFGRGGAVASIKPAALVECFGRVRSILEGGSAAGRSVEPDTVIDAAEILLRAGSQADKEAAIETLASLVSDAATPAADALRATVMILRATGHRAYLNNED